MKNILLASTICFILTLAAHAQCVETPNDPCVSVKQSTLDRMSKVLDEYAAAQKVIDAQAKALAMTDLERTAFNNYRSTVEAAFAVLQKGLADRDKLIELQEKVTAAFADLVDKMAAQINKPKSAFSKFMQTLKEIALIATGLAIGAHL